MKIILTIEAGSAQEYQDALASLLFTVPTVTANVNVVAPDITANVERNSAPTDPDTEKVIYPETPAKEKPVKPAKPAKEKPVKQVDPGDREPAAEPLTDTTITLDGKPITLDDLRELAYPLNTGGDKTKAALKALLADYGAKSLGEVSADDYEELHTDMQKLHFDFGITI